MLLPATDRPALVSPLRPLRGVFFDLDGTLVDSWPGIAAGIRHAFDIVGRNSSVSLPRSYIGPPIRMILDTLAGQPPTAELDQIEAAFRYYYDSAGWRATTCIPGAAETLAELANRGLCLAVVTNKPIASAIQILEHLDLRRYFGSILSRDSVQPPLESKAAVVEACLRNNALAPGDALMVGDTLEDCQAAAAHGLAAVWVLSGYGRPGPQDQEWPIVGTLRRVIPYIEARYHLPN